MNRVMIWSVSLLGTASVLLAPVSPSASAVPSVAITENSAGLSATTNPDQIVVGPDGNLWFSDFGEGGGIGRMTPSGGVTLFPTGLPAPQGAVGLAVGTDGNLWFTDSLTSPGSGLIGRMTLGGVVTTFTTGISDATYAIAAGSDGNMWFTEYGGNIGKITPAGVVTEYPTHIFEALGIVGGPDGNLWFASGDISVGRITTQGAVTIFTAGITKGTSRITLGPDGALWFTEIGGIGRITTAGVATEYSSGLPASNEPVGIITGRDGALWFADYGANQIGRVTTAGAITMFSSGISAGAGPQEITAGPDGNLWFTESQAKNIAKVVVTGSSSAPVLPSTRLSGPDRIATAVAVSGHEYPSVGSAHAVVLSRADSFPDALAGVPLAVSLHAPLLLTSPTSLSATTEAEIKRVLPSGGSVTLLGGTGAISDAVSAQLQADGYIVERDAGTDRDATALAIAAAIPTPKVILLANGQDFADALSAGAAAAHAGGVLLLTDATTLAPTVNAYLTAHPGVPVYAVGGPAATADPAATKVAGADRYSTSVDVARQFFTTPTVVGLANGVTFSDALAGGVDVASAGGPLLLVEPTTLPTVASNYITSTLTVTAVIVFGGPAAISNAVAATT